MRAKLLVSLVLAAASSSVFAMPYEPTKHPALLEVALTGGGFKIDGSNTDFSIGATSVVANLASGNVLQNDPKYKFGGAVELGYYFADSTINVDASWTAARARDTEGATGAVTALLVPPGILAATAPGAVSSDYHFDYDLINLEVGSLTRVNQNGLILNPKLGLTYARLKGDQTVTYTGGTLAALDPAVVGQESVFRGFGPSIGMDLNFVVCNPINLTGNIRYSALVGDVNGSNIVTTGAAGVVGNTVGFGTSNAIVSVIQTELALGYDFNWSDMFCGNFAIGYQLTKALDAAQSLYFVDDVADSMFVNEVFNKSIHGYFARLTMDFAV